MFICFQLLIMPLLQRISIRDKRIEFIIAEMECLYLRLQLHACKETIFIVYKELLVALIYRDISFVDMTALRSLNGFYFIGNVDPYVDEGDIPIFSACLSKTSI